MYVCLQERFQEEQRIILTNIHSQKVAELNLKAHLARLILTYAEVLVWFADAGLLPELPPPPADNDDDDGNDDYPVNPFPVAAMVANYSDIRSAMRDKLREWDFGTQGTDGGPLMVDGLCHDLGDTVKANFERDGGNGLYPPPTLRYGFENMGSFLLHE